MAGGKVLGQGRLGRRGMPVSAFLHRGRCPDYPYTGEINIVMLILILNHRTRMTLAPPLYSSPAPMW